MKRLAYGAVCVSMLLVLAGCGDRPVDESILPTRVPPLDPDTFAVTVVPPTPEPTATPVPAPTTVPAPTATSAATPDVAAAADVTAAEPLTATNQVAAAEEITTTGAITATTPDALPTLEPTVEPTAAPTVEVTTTDAITDAGDAPTGATTAPLELPAGVAAALAQADPLRGQQLTLSSACIGCHALDPNQVMPGPTWRNVGATAATRVAGQSAEVYLHNSIIHPNDYIVEGFLPNIMLQIYQDTLSEQNLADLIAYLLTLKNN